MRFQDRQIICRSYIDDRRLSYMKSVICMLVTTLRRWVVDGKHQYYCLLQSLKSSYNKLLVTFPIAQMLAVSVYKRKLTHGRIVKPETTESSTKWNWQFVSRTITFPSEWFNVSVDFAVSTPLSDGRYL